MSQRNRWVPILTLFPFLYFIGWLVVQPLLIFKSDFLNQSLSLIGTLVSFLLFIVVLPSWIKFRWSEPQPWEVLGLRGSLNKKAWKDFLKGFLYALGLIILIVSLLWLQSSVDWRGELRIGMVINALLLGFGVGLAEELIFRGWLLGELSNLLGFRFGVFGQAMLFSLVHTRFNIGLWPLVSLLLGLLLLGMVLALLRAIDKGSLWGCIGLHGGLVGLWFLVDDGLVDISLDASKWLVGPGGESPNPIGGALGILVLTMFLWVQLTAFAIGGRPLRGARNDSSKGATP